MLCNNGGCVMVINIIMEIMHAWLSASVLTYHVGGLGMNPGCIKKGIRYLKLTVCLIPLRGVLKREQPNRKFIIEIRQRFTI